MMEIIMKKLWIVVVLALALAGCGGGEDGSENSDGNPAPATTTGYHVIFKVLSGTATIRGLSNGYSQVVSYEKNIENEWTLKSGDYFTIVSVFNANRTLLAKPVNINDALDDTSYPVTTFAIAIPWTGPSVFEGNLIVIDFDFANPTNADIQTELWSGTVPGSGSLLAIGTSPTEFSDPTAHINYTDQFILRSSFYFNLLNP